MRDLHPDDWTLDYLEQWARDARQPITGRNRPMSLRACAALDAARQGALVDWQRENAARRKG